MPHDGDVISNNEREFILAALREDQRIDGRRPFDMRKLTIKFGKTDGSVEVQLGQTRVMAVVTAELVPPFPDRSSEGMLAVFTEFSPMADPAFEPGRPSEAAVELGRVVDRGLRESRAVDTEALCVVAGQAVWSVRLDLHILDHCGNMIDASNTAALVALLDFRRPDCSVGGADGQEVTVHPVEERDPVPLAIHHLPIALTFGFFENGELALLDPSFKEEVAMDARLTITINSQGEICAVQKGGGTGIAPDQVLRCMRIASTKAADVTSQIRNSMEGREKERRVRKERRVVDVGGGGEGVREGRKEARIEDKLVEMEEGQEVEDDEDEDESEVEEEDEEEEEEGVEEEEEEEGEDGEEEADDDESSEEGQEGNKAEALHRKDDTVGGDKGNVTRAEPAWGLQGVANLWDGRGRPAAMAWKGGRSAVKEAPIDSTTVSRVSRKVKGGEPVNKGGTVQRGEQKPSHQGRTSRHVDEFDSVASLISGGHAQPAGQARPGSSNNGTARGVLKRSKFAVDGDEEPTTQVLSGEFSETLNVVASSLSAEAPATKLTLLDAVKVKKVKKIRKEKREG